MSDNPVKSVTRIRSLRVMYQTPEQNYKYYELELERPGSIVYLSDLENLIHNCSIEHLCNIELVDDSNQLT